MNRQDGTKTIYIGRDAKNDIVIDNSSISRSHAMISLVGGEYRLKDNNSLNGVFVNGRKVEFEIIGPQDRITIGTEYMLDWSRIEKAFRSKAAEASQADLSGPSISIGRDPDNDVVVNNAAVSRKHAKIYVNEVTGSGTRYYIKDLGSRNGLFVNGEKITSRQISPNDNITLGSICHLNWQDIQAAQRRKFRPAPPPPPPPPPPTIISEPTPKKDNNTGLWVAGVAVLFFIFIAIVLLVGRQGGTEYETHPIKRVSLIHSYPVKRGETDDIAKRRAKIEAQRELMEKTKEYFPNNNSFLENYTIFLIVIEGQTKDDSQNAIVTSLYTEMNEPDFEAKDLYLNQHEEIKAKLAEEQMRLDLDHELVVEAEHNLETSYDNWSGGMAGYYDPAEPNSDWESYDPERTYQKAKSVYEEQISAYFDDLESVNEIKTAVASIKAEPKTKDSPGLLSRITGKVRSLIPGLHRVEGPLDVYLKLTWLNSNEVLDYYETTYGSRKLKSQWNIEIDEKTASQIYDIVKSLSDKAGLKIDKMNKTDFNVEYIGSNIAKISLNQSGQQKIKGVFSQSNLEGIGKVSNELLQRMFPDENFKDFNPLSDREELNRYFKEKFGVTMDECLDQAAANEVYYMIKEGGKWKRYLCEDDAEYKKYQYWKTKYYQFDNLSKGQ